MSDVRTFDATADPDLLPQSMYDFLRSRYWVIVQPNEEAFAWDWVMSVREPRPVPNPTMSWRRPTYGEAQSWWDLTHTDRMFDVRRSWPEEIRARMEERRRRYCR